MGFKFSQELLKLDFSRVLNLFLLLHLYMIKWSNGQNVLATILSQGLVLSLHFTLKNYYNWIRPEMDSTEQTPVAD